MINQISAHTKGSRGEAVRLLNQYGLSDEDLALVRSLGATIEPHMDSIVDGFYEWLATQPEYEEFFSDPQVLKRVKGLVTDHWHNLFQADIDEGYLERRQRIGATHARIGLPLNS